MQCNFLYQYSESTQRSRRVTKCRALYNSGKNDAVFGAHEARERIVFRNAKNIAKSFEINDLERLLNHGESMVLRDVTACVTEQFNGRYVAFQRTGINPES
jgi:hypothetical protein